MDTNMLIFYIIISLFATALIAVEFFIFKFAVSLFKLDKKFDRPIQVLSLLIVEVVAVATSLDVAFKSPWTFAIMCIFLGVKIWGLWNMKKWVLYFYLFANMVSWYVSSLSVKGKDVTTIVVAGIIGSLLILLFYYLQVYVPNKKEFA